MSKLLVTGTKSHIEAVIRELYKLNVLHIMEHVRGEEADIGQPLKDANKLSEILVRIRSLVSHLNISKKDDIREINLKKGYHDLDAASQRLMEDVNKSLEESKASQDKIEKNKELAIKLKELKPLKLSLDSFGSYKSIVYFAGYLDNVEGFEKKLRETTEKFEIYKTDKKKKLIALFVEESKGNKVLELLREFDFSDFDLSSVKELKGDIEPNLARLEEENSKSAKDFEIASKHIEKLKNEQQDYLLFGEQFLAKEVEKAEAPLKFAATKSAFVVRGWVPSADLNHVVERLNRVTKEKVFIQAEDPGKMDEVPVKLNNPKAVKPFEFFMSLYALPTYKEIDPTFLIFLVFPLLFGFMLGDIGYGIITLIFALFMRKKLPKVKTFFDIFVFSSISTIIFGMLFGEIFGEEVLFGVHLPHILSRAHSVDILLTVSIIFGIIHLLTGLIIGFINVYREHGLKEAVFEKVGWILLFPALTKLILSLNLIKGVFSDVLNLIIPNNYIIIALAVIGIIIIIKGEGVGGIIELPGIFSNILSYSRLMAIGIASVMLAIVVNDIAKGMFQGGIIMVILGIIVLIIGHTINILLGWLGCFLQSLRLHYVEFFTKFFKGGAQPYKPFGVKD